MNVHITAPVPNCGSDLVVVENCIPPRVGDEIFIAKKMFAHMFHAKIGGMGHRYTIKNVCLCLNEGQEPFYMVTTIFKQVVE